MSLVSVIIPMYNAEAFISATLDSILQERDISLEVVVVDDNSTDASLDRVGAIKDERVRVVNGPGKGIASALNAGLSKVRGEIIMRCDADDLYSSKRIKQQVELLAKYPEFGAVCGGFSTIDVKGRLIVNLKCGENAEEISEELKNGITRTHFCTFACRVEFLRALGGFRPYFKTAEDIDFQLRLGELCRVWYVPEIQYYYRLHDLSITHRQSNVEREFFEFIAREFQRQRHTQGSDELQRGSPPLLPLGVDTSVKTATEHIQGMLMGHAWQEHQAGHKWQALNIGVRSVITRPSNLTAWRSLLALAVKPAGKNSAL